MKFEAGNVNKNLSGRSKFCSNQTISGTYLEEISRFLLLTAVRMFYSLTTVQGKPIIVFPWQHSTVLYCWQVHVGQRQQKWKTSWRFHGSPGYASTPQYYVILRIFPILLFLSSASPGNSCNRKSSYATTASFPILSNSLFINHPPQSTHINRVIESIAK